MSESWRIGVFLSRDLRRKVAHRANLRRLTEYIFPRFAFYDRV